MMDTQYTLLSDLYEIPFDELKKTLSKQGVNTRGWRLYLNHGDAMFMPLIKGISGRPSKNLTQTDATSWLQLLQACEMDVLPPFVLTASICNWSMPQNKLAAIPPLFLRAAWQATLQAEYAGRHIQRFVREVITPVAIWFFESGEYSQISKAQLKAGWSSLHKKYQLACLERNTPIYDWAPFVTEVKCSGYQFNALASQVALQQEANAMSHCIDSYAERCQNTLLRAWSVRDDKSGRRVATLTVNEVVPGRWEVEEIYGPNNSTPEQSAINASHFVVCSMEESYRRNLNVRSQMDVIRQRASEYEWDA